MNADHTATVDIHNQLASLAIAPLPFNLQGAGTTWAIRNDIGTSNGLPAGGVSNNAPGFPGFGVAEASVGLQADAFDNGLLMFIDNQIFVAPSYAERTTRQITTDPVSISGLNVTVQHYADPNLPILRTLVTFENTSAMPSVVPVTLATNVGSDGATAIQATSSGDTAFSTGDRWLITDDNPTTGSPAVTHVLFGPGAPVVNLNAVATTVYDFSPFAGTEGVLADYNVSIPGQASRSLLFFTGINGTSADAQTNALLYNTLSALQATTLLTGLTDLQLAHVLNWEFRLPGVGVSSLTGTTSENGGQATFTFSLNSAPTANVTLNFTSSDLTEGRSPNPIVFTPSNWNIEQTVTVVGLNDAVVDGDIAYAINTAITSSDARYSALSVQPLQMVNLDNDLSSQPPKTVSGTRKDDKLKGSNRDDVLLGNKGDDVLNGRKGDDLLDGGLGADMLTGSQGADVFRYAAATTRQTAVTSQVTKRGIAVDTITDFNVRKGQGDRVLVDVNNTDALPSTPPRQLFNAGVTKGQRSVVGTLRKVYRDWNPVQKGRQSVEPNQAVIVKSRNPVTGQPQMFMAINDGTLGFQPKNELVIELKDPTLMRGDQNVGVLTVEDYFI